MTNEAARSRTDPRITRRRKAIERSRRKRLVVGVCIAAVAAVLLWMAFWSPLLEIRRVRVTGSKHVTSTAVTRAAHLNDGGNLLLMSTAEVRKEIETLPWVRTARVDRSLPGTVLVRVVDRKPALVLSLGAADWLIDRTGHILSPARGQRHLPTLAGVHASTIRPGVRLHSAGGVGALRAWRSMPLKLARRVKAVFAPTVDAITFTLDDGTTVRYGAPQSMKDKNRVVLALLHKSSAEGTGASYIDVRVPTSPAVAPALPQPTPSVRPASASPSPSARPSPRPSPTPTG